MTNNEESNLDASPVKSFFVKMLTRDISLEDSILDLLDNCIDGVLRQGSREKSEKPYEGYWAEIEFDEKSFTISDNCGGIPWKLRDYAFRMGRDSSRDSENTGGVGVYGIGMKRAIFKMGEHCKILTYATDRSYEVEIDQDWMNNEGDWEMPVKSINKPKGDQNGTRIHIATLREGVAREFGAEKNIFQIKLKELIATHYAFIIAKGFAVKVNGDAITPSPTKLSFSDAENGIKPYIFRGEHDGVEVFITVGLTRRIPNEEELTEGQEGSSYSSLDAGWTVICNERAVIYCNRDQLTGWGEYGVPRYHTQFIAISGIVEFKSDDPLKLPTTTTKRGIDASSLVYLQAKKKMNEGLLVFTSYTNRWKGREEEAKEYIADSETLTFEEIKSKAQKIGLKKATRTEYSGEYYKPRLQMPENTEEKQKRISFSKPINEVETVAEYLFGDPDTVTATDVGKECFEKFLKRAKS